MTKISVFYLIFTRGGGGGQTRYPTKNTSFALGMRRACVSMVRRTEAIA